MWLFFPLFFSNCNTAERKLNRMWPGKKSFLSASQVREGFILTRNNDTLKGYINISTDGPLDNVSLLPFNKTKRSDIINVKPGDIDFVRMKFPSEADSTDYMPIPIKPLKGNQVKTSPDKSLMYQILGTKNQWRLCYYEWGDGDSDGNMSYHGELVLVTKKDSIVSLQSGMPGAQKPSRFLLQFINERYSQHFKKEDFKDVKAKIDYVLGQEYEKQLNK